jgi:hypothetical protein
MTEDDIPWMWGIGRRRYSHRYNGLCLEMWYRNIVLKQTTAYFPVRTDNAFCITMITIMPWLPNESEANVVMICAEEGKVAEAITLLRRSIEWGRERLCTSWRMSSETDYDLAMIAKRLGAKEIWPRYALRY